MAAGLSAGATGPWLPLHRQVDGEVAPRRAVAVDRGAASRYQRQRTRAPVRAGGEVERAQVELRAWCEVPVRIQVEHGVAGTFEVLAAVRGLGQAVAAADGTAGEFSAPSLAAPGDAQACSQRIDAFQRLV